MNAKDYLILAGAATLAYLLLRWARTENSPMNSYLKYANSVPPGFVFDPVLDAYARTRSDGVKEVYV